MAEGWHNPQANQEPSPQAKHWAGEDDSEDVSANGLSSEYEIMDAAIQFENADTTQKVQDSTDSDESEEEVDHNLFDSCDKKSSKESSEDDEIATAADGEAKQKKWNSNETELACKRLYFRAPRIDMNLMHDFTESDLFVIDGDSVLADIFSHKGIDFSHGGQLLHIIYLVELFLQDFQEREGQFHVLFFTEAETIWHSDPLKLLTRRAVILHLARNTNCKLITHIAHPYTQQWREYVGKYHPSFIMLSDGESLQKQNGRRMLVQLLLLSSVQLGVDCAFCSPLRRSLRSINTFYVEARKARPSPRTQQIANDYERTANNLRMKSAQCTSDQELSMVCDQLLSIVENHGKQAGLLSTSRDVITIIAGADVMKEARHKQNQDKAFTEGLTRACILHSILLQCLPLTARALNTPNDAEISPFSAGLMSDFLERMHYAMARWVGCYDQLRHKLTGIEGSTETGSLADLMDGRLLYVVLYQLQSFTQNDIEASYPPEIIAKFRYMWQVTQSLARQDTNDNIAELSVAVDHVLLTAPVQIYESTSVKLQSMRKLAIKQKGLVPVSSPLVTDYAEKLLKELESKCPINISSASASAKKFEETYHWYSGKPLKDDYDNTNAAMLETLSSDPRERKHQLLHKQRFARYMQNYGESLEGKAHGLLQQTITVDSKMGRDGKKMKSGGHQGQKNKQGMSKKEMILKKKIMDDQRKADVEANGKWKTILSGIKSDVSKEKYSTAVKKMNDFINHCHSDKWTLEAIIAKMDCYWLAWKQVKSAAKTTTIQCSPFSDLTPKHPMYFPIMLFICCQELMEYRELLDKSQLLLIGAYMQGLGFLSLNEYIQGSVDSDDDSTNNKRPSKPIFSKSPPVENECVIGMTSTRFQLQFFGQWMKRNVRTDKDERVPYFIPDTWQSRDDKKNACIISKQIESINDANAYLWYLRELLDVVDKNESALIVAPTSSGKTFASYYCMEKVLRQSDDGVVVYVSPTKALMNQVSATVYARFNKNLPPGKVVCGVFSRDFRRNALNCQILVTVPQCLEILLLSPRRRQWVSKIQYVIFDEVHCLGGEIGAEVWEHLLVSINCPFLALSATIRNPGDIQGWLQASQDFKQQQAQEVLQQGSKKQNKKRGSSRVETNAYKVGLIVWKERHSDLEKYVYMPKPHPKELIMPKDKLLSDTAEFVPLHPVAMLDLKKVKSQGLPADLTLSPRETLILYDTMKAVYPDSQNLKALNPELHFKDIPILKKQDARDYEIALKKELMSWIQKEDKENKACNVISSLKQNLAKKHFENEVGLYSDLTALVNYDKLIRQLNEQHKLPALVFSQDRRLCEKLAIQIVDTLEQTEEQLRKDFKTTEKYKDALKLMAQVEKRARKAKNKETGPNVQKKGDNLKEPGEGICLRGKRIKEVSDSWQQRPIWRRPGANRKSDQFQDSERFAACLNEADEDESKKLMDAKHFLLGSPLPQCTLQGEGNLTEEELNEILRRLPNDETSNTLRWLIARGVAYHHAGLNNKQRVAVETLFRRNHLKVVTATATLALGIHMPCKTVVFACEDLYLKPLAFRQMSGRSGRRGFDLVGNVIFYCIPPQKVQHLVTSGLPHVRGHFPFSVSFVLRLMVLTYNSGDKRDAHEQALALLKHPFVCHSTVGMEEVVQHFFLFSVDYLIRAGLLDTSGAPIGLSGLATHLHYHEPANLTFVTMLHEGAFHKLCNKKDSHCADGTFSSSVMEKLVLVLAYMFNRILVPMSTFFGIQRQKVHSKVVFDQSLPMPQNFSDILEKHNRDVSEVFRRYVHSVSDYAAKGTDSVEQNVLPLSKVAIQPAADIGTPATGIPASEGNLIDALTLSANQSNTFSPFVMTSGHSDKDLSMFEADISKANRQGVHIEHTKIPKLPLVKDLKDSRGKPMFVNAFAYDFFKHGSKKLIMRENRLQSGDTFDKLRDFYLVIAAISTALKELGPKEDEVVQAFLQLKEEYGNKFKKEYIFSQF